MGQLEEFHDCPDSRFVDRRTVDQDPRTYRHLLSQRDLNASAERMADRGAEVVTQPGRSRARCAISILGAVPEEDSRLRLDPEIRGWDGEGRWNAVPYLDEKAAEPLFRQKVISLLASEGLLGRERLELLDSWKSGHNGFSAHNRVTVSPNDGAGLDRRLGRGEPGGPSALRALQGVNEGLVWAAGDRPGVNSIRARRRGHPLPSPSSADPLMIIRRALDGTATQPELALPARATPPRAGLE